MGRVLIAALMVSFAGMSAAQASKTVAKEVIRGITMVTIPAGSFMMGSDYDVGRNDTANRFYPDEQPVHRVTLSTFQIGATEITQAQYQQIMGANPSTVIGDDFPVTGVSGNDAAAFCNLLSKAAGFEPCYDEKTGKCDFSKNGFRLPTEAEWEYACRAGTTSLFNTGNSARDLDRAGWHIGNSGGKPHPAGRKAPNAWGLFDMHGNVWEFCYDGFDETYSSGNYTAEPVVNPAWDRNFNLRITRGGGFFSEPAHCRSAVRGNFWTGGGNWYTGFRVARSFR